MLNGCLSTAALFELTGYTRPADVERCLRDQGVKYFWGKDGPWTTLELINAAGGLRQSGNDGMYEERIL